MTAMLDWTHAYWGLGAAMLLGPTIAMLFAMRGRRRLFDRLSNLEDVLRRMRTLEPASRFGGEGEESTMQLSRERLMLTNLLDRFPEVTQKFANIQTSEKLGEAILEAFRNVLGSHFGLAFVLEGDVLRLIGRDGIDATECPEELTFPVDHGRVGYVTRKCLILRGDDFPSVDRENRTQIEQTRVFERDFDFYIPLVESHRPVGCVVIGGMRKVVSKAHSVSMALANLGALVLSNLQRAAEIRALGATDPLTRLSNRRHCYELLDARLHDAENNPFALCLFDVDHFKAINDDYGHQVGDEVLVRVADEVRKFVETESREFGCRFGGEEFLCVLNCGDIAALAARLEEFREAVTRIVAESDGGPEPRQVRISGGVAFCPAEFDNADELIKLADDRLYGAKQAGRNRIFLETMTRNPA